MARASTDGHGPAVRPTRRPSARVVVALAMVVLAIAGVGCLAVGLSFGSRGPATKAAADHGDVENAAMTRDVVRADPAKVTTQAARGSRPVRIRSVAAGLDAPVVPVRLVDAALTPPAQAWQAGWWTERARPGAPRGPVVLVGHTVSGGGGAFATLPSLGIGAPITVTTSAGPVSYEVAKVRVVSRGAFARWAPALTSPRGRPRLVLVTCTGWDGREFRSNVVVVAHPVA